MRHLGHILTELEPKTVKRFHGASRKRRFEVADFAPKLRFSYTEQVNLRFLNPWLLIPLVGAIVSGCATIPESKVTWYKWPKAAYKGVPERDFDKLGQVRTRIEYNSLDFENDENKLCRNFFNKASADLVRRAKEVGADAVIDIRSVVFQIDGRADTFETPECTDDGVEGQVLVQGVAIKWKKPLAKGTRVKTYSARKQEIVPASPVLAPSAKDMPAPMRIPAAASASDGTPQDSKPAAGAAKPGT
jgi:hypothetical protein